MSFSSRLFSCALKERQNENKLENQHACRFLTDVFLKSRITKDVFLSPSR